MKTALALAAFVAVLAGAAGAQTPAPAPSPAAPAGAAPPSVAPDATVSGVTVKPLPLKPCAPKDKDCAAYVMAQLKEFYPEQLKQFCFQQKVEAMRRDMQATIAGWCDSPGRGATAMCSHYVAPAIKQVCASDPVASKAADKK